MSGERGTSYGKIWLSKLDPSMGPFPLRDNWGMKTAVAILVCTFNPGTYES